MDEHDWFLKLVFVPIQPNNGSRFVFRRRFNRASLLAMYSFIDCLVSSKSALWRLSLCQLQTI